MSLDRDWPWTALVMALGQPGAYDGEAIIIDADTATAAGLSAILDGGALPCGLPVRIAEGAGVRVSPAVFWAEA